MTRQHKVEGTDKLLMQTIQDQAADLEHGWREAVQNGIDSPGAETVELDYDRDTTVVRDDGDGVDLDSDAGLALLKNLGETSKEGDADSIGRFGVGKGQIVAKGHTAFLSGTTVLHYNVRAWGLTVKTVPLPDERAVDGLEVRVSHYNDEVPNYDFKWNDYDGRVRSRFAYTSMARGVDVVVNGDVVSRNQPADAVDSHYSKTVTGGTDGPRFTAAIEPSSTDDVSVHSNGVYVKDVDYQGVGGVVVTDENLDLNFARNDIKSGCPVWEQVSDALSEAVEEMLMAIPDDRLSAQARSFLAERSMEGGNIDAERPMFKTVDGREVSMNDINSASQVAFENGTDQRARRLAEGWSMTILDTTDEATAALHDKMQQVKEIRDALPEEFDVDEKADEVSLPDTHETLTDRDANSVQRRKLAAARRFAEEIGCSRTVRWGESDVSDSWTDGHDEIVLTDGAAPSRNKAAWIPSVFRAVVKQASSREDTRGEEPSGTSFSRRYAEKMEDHFDAMASMAEEADRNGIEAAFGGTF